MDSMSSTNSNVPQCSCSDVNCDGIHSLYERDLVACCSSLPKRGLIPTYSSQPGPQIEHLYLHWINKTRNPLNPWKKTHSSTEAQKNKFVWGRGEGEMSRHIQINSMTRLAKINKNQFYMSILSEFVGTLPWKSQNYLDKGLGFNK